MGTEDGKTRNELERELKLRKRLLQNEVIAVQEENQLRHKALRDGEKELRQKAIRTHLESEARKAQIDPELLKETRIHEDEKGIHLKWKGVEVTTPAPSQKAVDGWWEKYAGFITGAFVALVGVALGSSIGSKRS